MLITLFPWILPPLITLIISSIGALVVWKRRHLTGGTSLFLLFLSILEWALFQGISVFVDDIEWKILLSKIEYIGIVSVPVIWASFCLSSIGWKEYLTKKRLFIISLIPMITFLLVITNEFHHLVWESYTAIDMKGYTGTEIVHGSWFQIHAVYVYVLILGSTLSAIIRLGNLPSYRKQLLAIALAPSISLVVNLIYLKGGFRFVRLDLTPLGFSLSALVLVWVLLKHQLLQLIPIARSVLIEKMNDAIFVVDTQGKIIDINPVSCQLLQLSSAEILGQPLDRFFTEKQSRALLSSETNGRIEIKRSADEYWEASVSPLSVTEASGLLIVFRNITLMKKAQHELERAQKKLKRANQELEQLANTDMLTSLPNRRFFFEQLSLELKRSKRTGQKLSLMLLDLDHFKRVNDTYGHPVGDEVLKRVSRELRINARELDVPGRLGGEEFGFILPETSLKGALRFAERIRDIIEHCHSGEEIPITVSIGVSELGEDASLLFEETDKALYKAKENGRNRVEFFSEKAETDV